MKCPKCQNEKILYVERPRRKFRKARNIAFIVTAVTIPLITIEFIGYICALGCSMSFILFVIDRVTRHKTSLQAICEECR